MTDRRVVVDGRYTYSTDLALEVGDRVLLPGEYGSDWAGVVTALSSSYTGPTKRIIRFVEGAAVYQERLAAEAAVPMRVEPGWQEQREHEGCGGTVTLTVTSVNKMRRPDTVTIRCDKCGPVCNGMGLGTAASWRATAAAFHRAL